MTLQQLRYMILVAECGSINEAAKKLFITQPSLSGAIKELEEEIGMDLFFRSNRGITITPDGEEFLSYARQVADQYQLLTDKFIEKKTKKKFSVSMQHYSFAVEAFVQLVKCVGMEEYEFAIHETKTYEVIENVHNSKSELGVLYLSEFNEKVLQKILRENGLQFVELFECDTYVYLWNGHPLAKRDVISMKDLEEYPCLTFEQGWHNSFYYSEEVKSTYEYKRLIKIDDRATVLNLMVGLNGYTLCSGIINEELNGDEHRAIPLLESEKMRIGYIKKKGTMISHLGNLYIEKLMESIGDVYHS